jgi:hypothetical protein
LINNIIFHFIPISPYRPPFSIPPSPSPPPGRLNILFYNLHLPHSSILLPYIIYFYLNFFTLSCIHLLQSPLSSNSNLSLSLVPSSFKLTYPGSITYP